MRPKLIIVLLLAVCLALLLRQGPVDRGKVISGEYLTSLELQEVSRQIRQYSLTVGQLPPPNEDLVSELMRKGLYLPAYVTNPMPPCDGWGRLLHYDVTGDTARVWSTGADGLPSTQDDMVEVVTNCTRLSQGKPSDLHAEKSNAQQAAGPNAQ
jgi:hypothetical protein